MQRAGVPTLEESKSLSIHGPRYGRLSFRRFSLVENTVPPKVVRTIETFIIP